MSNYIITVVSLLVFSCFWGCKTTELSGRNPIRDAQRVRPRPPSTATEPQTQAPGSNQRNPSGNQPTIPNTITSDFIGNPIYIPPTPVTPAPNIPVIRWEPRTISMDASKGYSPEQSPAQTSRPPVTAEPPPPPTLTEACRADVLAANASIVLQGQTFAATGKASSLRGVKTTVSAFTSIVVTLDNGKTYSSNNIFAAIVRGGRPDFTVSRGYSESGAAWYEVGGYGGIFGQITYSGNSAVLNLVNGACVVQYGAANGGYPYLVLP